jgi:hypothetical protein
MEARRRERFVPEGNPERELTAKAFSWKPEQYLSLRPACERTPPAFAHTRGEVINIALAPYTQDPARFVPHAFLGNSAAAA